jgi:hypothetical protein
MRLILPLGGKIPSFPKLIFRIEGEGAESIFGWFPLRVMIDIGVLNSQRKFREDFLAEASGDVDFRLALAGLY